MSTVGHQHSSAQRDSGRVHPPAANAISGPTNLVVTCGTCFGVMQEPVTLPCGHSFCLRCVKEKLTRSGVGDGIVCLLCGQHHAQVTIRNVSDLIDVDLAQKIDLLARGADPRPACQWCEEQAATVHCVDCLYTLCADCNLAVHKNAAKRHHQPATIQDGRALKSLSRKCAEPGHEEYKLEFYCTRCECLCCAYCLQIGPHKQHMNVLVNAAATEARQQMGRDLENLSQTKARIESQGNELNRVHTQYLETYDYAESLITDRFNAFRQQLLQKEVEVRRILQSLREVGDNSLGEARGQFMQKLNAINVAGMSFRRLQHGGADYEVLENRSAMSAFVKTEVPMVSGTGFHLSNMGDLNLGGLTVSLDMRSTGVPSERSGGAHHSHQHHGGPSSSSGLGPAEGGNGQHQQGDYGGGTDSAAAAVARSSSSGGPPPMQQRRQIRFTFNPDRDIEIRGQGDESGQILLHCSEKTQAKQIGVKANESMESWRSLWKQEDNLISWRVRLDLMTDGFIGIVETVGSGNPQGFYWRPMKIGQMDGQIGRRTHLLRTLPACNSGDVVRFTYDVTNKALKLSVNNIDRGIILTEVSTTVAPCFVFYPGEAVTFMN